MTVSNLVIAIRTSRVCTCLLLWVWMVSWSAAGEAKRILILNPYSRNVEPFSSAISSFRSTLSREYRQPLDFQEIPLDLARSGGPDGEGPLVSFLEDRIRREPVDLVVPIGSAGVQFVARHRERLFAESQILAVAAEPRMIPGDFLNRNATLVSQRANLAGFVEDILRMKPDTQQIAVVMGSSPLEKFWATECRKAFKRYEGRVNFTWLDELSYAEVMDRCSKLPPRSFILHALYLMDKDGVSIEANDALKQLHQSANAPVFAFFESEMGMGSTGGHLLENSRMGAMAARAAVQILGGRNAGDIPPEDLGEPIPRYDWRELRRWEIPISRLPAGSVVMFQEPGFWERYRWPVIGIASFVIVESLLILGLLVNRRKRIQGEQEATLIAEVSSKFVNLPAEEVDREIIDAQRRICQFLDLDLSVLWQVPEVSAGHFNATHVYQTEGGPAALPPFRQEDFPWVRNEMTAGRTVMLARMAEMPADAAKDRATVASFGIKSTLTIPLAVGGEQAIGVLSFNTLRQERAWPGALVNRLQFVAQIFANALARKRTDRALRESEERLTLAVNSAEAGLWVMDCHTFEFWATERARTLFGYSQDEEITLSRFKESVHPEDWAPVQQSLDRAMQDGEPINVEYRIRLGDGRERWLVSRGRAFSMAKGKPERLQGLSMDISERKRTEEQVRQLSHAVEQSPVAVIITDLEGRMVYVNRKFCEVSGYALAECLGRNPRILKSGETSPATYKEMWASITSGQIWRGEFHNRKKNGDLYWEWAVISPLFDATGRITHFVGVKEDITAQRKAEVETKELREALAHSDRVSQLGHLASALAHELSQPLGAILRNAEAAKIMMKEAAPDLDELRAIVEDILHDDQRAGQVINRLRSLLKRGTLDPRPMDLCEVIEEALSLVRAGAMARHVNLEFSCAPRLPWVNGDRVQLQQVLINLVVNAIDSLAAAGSGSADIRVEVRQTDATSVEVEVADNGPGIPEDVLPHLFQPFFTTKAKGMGIGLTISNTIIEAHHGKLWAVNDPAGGARFCFTLPVMTGVPAIPAAS